MTARLVLDWDGTCTEVDGLHMILERFGDRSVYRQMEGALGDGLTLHEVIAGEIATITLPLDRGAAWVREHVTLRAGFHELAAQHRPVIVSSGFRELIEPVCATCGEPCKRRVLAGEPYVYAGDGYSDRCAALAAERVFARDGLARWLGEQGIRYEPFRDLWDVLDGLG